MGDPKTSQSILWSAITTRVSQHPWRWFGCYLIFELWVLSIIPTNILSESVIARTYVNAIAALSPVIHRFDALTKTPEVTNFFMAISVFLFIPKIIFFVGWLRSAKLGIYRYFVISPYTKSIPGEFGNFIKDAGLSDKEIAEQEILGKLKSKPIPMKQRILASIGILFVVFSAGILVPWFFFGKGEHPGPFEALAVEGGWRLWFAWSVYCLTLSAAVCAVGYCILVEYVQWFKDSFFNRSRR